MVEKEALPAFRVTGVSAVPFTVKVTEPVGTPEPEAGFTVAVNVTF